ncbi:MAG: hypothetical protein J3R72DRAFT_530179 [Linnemannia gamsii]|nr:MAG: hypothetical protein J3R72DRAFT_530179 [Linnemannia gamsii]
MSSKFQSIYFSTAQENGSPQERAFKHGDSNGHNFYVAYNILSRKRKPYCEYSVYRDTSAFLEAYKDIPAVDRCFNEVIREGRDCAEYYDIDWELEADDDQTIQDLEIYAFSSFLEARNRFKPEYPVTSEQCRVLSASSRSKVSLHIVIQQYVFDNNDKHMRAFMDSFKTMRGGKENDPAPTKYIDTTVYTKNRGIRILGSCKRDAPERVLVKADWHAASRTAPDLEFFITNIANEHCRVGAIAVAKQQRKATTTSPSRKKSVRPVVFDDEDEAPLPQFVVDAVRDLFSKSVHGQAYQFELRYDGRGKLFKLLRERTGLCCICEREHESDNAFLVLKKTGTVYMRCHRSQHTGGSGGSVIVGNIDYSQPNVATWRRTTPSPPAAISTDADETYTDQYVRHEHLSHTKILCLDKDNGMLSTNAGVGQEAPSLVIWSATGTGKGVYYEAIIAENPDYKFIVITPRRTLASSAGKRLQRLGFEDYRDTKGAIEADRVIVQAESLYRVRMEHYNKKTILILDEFCSLCEQMTSVETMGDRHDFNNKVFEWLIRHTARVICLDADFTDRDIRLVKSLRNDVRIIHNTYQPQKEQKVVMYEFESRLMKEVTELLDAGKRVWIASTFSASRTEGLHQTLKDGGFKGMCVTGQSSEQDKRTAASDINTLIKDLNYFIHTPAISVGIDCNVEDCVDTVVGFFSTQSNVPVETWRQQIRRVRHVKSNRILVYIDRSTSNRNMPTTEKDVNDWIRNQSRVIMGDMKSTPGLRACIDDQGIICLPDTPYSQIWMNVCIKRHKSMNGAWPRFVQQMQDAGCVVHDAKGGGDALVAKAIESKHAEVKREHSLCVANARCLTPEEYTKLQDTIDTASVDDRHAMTKYTLMRTYHITTKETVTPEWVLAHDIEHEKKIYRNLRALSLSDNGSTMQERLDMLCRYDLLSLVSGIENREYIQVPHQISDSRGVPLKYAVEILLACGFTDVFADNTVSADDIKKQVGEIWGAAFQDKQEHICTTLKLRKPTHNNWTFKNQLSFMNTILYNVLGARVVAVNRRNASYRLAHYSTVGTARTLSFIA